VARWFSPFAHLNAVPAEPWNADGALGMLAVAALLALAGCHRYARRDLHG
jgi:ABC-2 type transport system permease protein